MTALVSQEEVTAIHTSLMDMVENKQNHQFYHHVDMIDGIHIRTHIGYFPTNNRLYFKIEADYVLGEEEDEDKYGYTFKDLFKRRDVKMKEKEGLTEDDVRVLLLDIEQHASKLKFNKRLGRFLTYSRDCDNKDHVSGDDCGVCFGLTKMITTCCSHHLCVKCFQNLVSTRRCPFCREDEIYVQTSK
jgi:hypothetical protein